MKEINNLKRQEEVTDSVAAAEQHNPLQIH